jgi:hypothetical protein
MVAHLIAGYFFQIETLIPSSDLSHYTYPFLCRVFTCAQTLPMAAKVCCGFGTALLCVILP